MQFSLTFLGTVVYYRAEYDGCRLRGQQTGGWMGLAFCSFASGSSGNCYMIRSEKTTVLMDVGIAGKYVLAGLE